MAKYNSVSQAVPDFVEDIQVIKQIGKGSFSNVYLCERDTPVELQVFGTDAGSTGELNIPKKLIIKEINIDILVRKYIKSNYSIPPVDPMENTVEVNITPYGKHLKVPQDVKRRARVEEGAYYTKRLRQLIESEVEALSLITHDNIVTCYGCNKRDNVYYLNMEYCDLGDVYQLIEKDTNIRQPNGIVSYHFTYEFTKQTINGLVYLHEQGLIHRDIKLQNILVKNSAASCSVDTSNTVWCFKISDFGFACYDMTMNNLSADQDEILCKKYYKLCGTPYYMAPELINNMHKLEDITSFRERKTSSQPATSYNRKIDIWSLGVALFELMTGTMPFPEVKSIKELEQFYETEESPCKIIHKKILDKSCIPKVYKQMLYDMLQVDVSSRASAIELYKYTSSKNSEFIEAYNYSSHSIDLSLIVNESDNVYLPQVETTRMKDHIVKSPVQDHNEFGSWEHVTATVNDDTLGLMSLSIGKGFLDWLLGKT